MSYKIISTERQPRKNGGPRIVHTVECEVDGCSNTLKIRQPEIKNKKRFLCITHAHTKRPFEAIYNKFLNEWRELEKDLTYEDFIEFCKNESCHYCLTQIIRSEYPTVSGKYISSAYYLDRMDCEKGYLKNNLVSCCTKCNISRSNRYTYEEWYGMTKFYRDKDA
jgi:hypothetical protein